MHTGHWDTSLVNLNEENIESFVGFVYEITNKVSGKKYIGQKKFWKVQVKPPLKGKVNKRRKTVSSDWCEYTGSSDILNKDILEMGKDCFSFSIVLLCESKWEMSYYEYKRIIDSDAILRNDYYNGFLGRVGRPPEKLKI